MMAAAGAATTGAVRVRAGVTDPVLRLARATGAAAVGAASTVWVRERVRAARGGAASLFVLSAMVVPFH
jgi:hypothetical protein